MHMHAISIPTPQIDPRTMPLFLSLDRRVVNPRETRMSGQDVVA